MMMKPTNNDSERGSALLLTLGILSLVLIIAMGFAFSANTGLRVAKVQGAASDARTLVDGATDALLADMQYMFASGNSHVDIKGLYPPEELNISNTSVAAGLLQHVIAFDTSTDASGDNRQNYFYSKDMDRLNGGDSRSPYEKYYVGRLFSLVKPNANADESVNGVDPEDKYTNDMLLGDWFSYADSDFEDKLAYLPAVRPLVDVLKGDASETKPGIGFAPPLSIEYQLRDEAGNIETLNKVIGRYAYIVVEEGNKLDVNSTISLSQRLPAAVDNSAHRLFLGENRKFCDSLVRTKDYDAADNTAHYWFNLFSSVPTGDTYGEADTIRLGLLPEEIKLDNRYVSQLNASAAGGYVGWLSYQQMWECLAGVYKPSATDLNHVFLSTFFSLTDNESYKGEPQTGAGVTNPPDEYARLDLSGVSWGLASTTQLPGDLVDKATLKVISGNTAWNQPSGDTNDPANCALVRHLYGNSGVGNDALDREPMTFWRNESNEIPNYALEQWSSIGRLDWLHRMVADDGTTNVGLQVAANIKDYSDADNIATCETEGSILTPAANAAEFPNVIYCGNERVAYINKLLFRTNVSVANDPTKTGAYVYTPDLYAGVELLNIYACSDELSEPCDVPTGDVIVRVKLKLHVWMQKYQLQADNETVKLGPDNLPIPDGPPTEWNPDNTPAALSDTQQDKFIEIKSNVTDADARYWDDDSSCNAVIKQKHMGYNAFYMKKGLELSQALKNEIQSNANKVRYCFKFTITDAQVISYKAGEVISNTAGTGTDDTKLFKNLYDVAVMPRNDAAYTDNTSEKEFPIGLPTPDTFKSWPNLVVFLCKDSRFNHAPTSWEVKTFDDTNTDFMNHDNGMFNFPSPSWNGVTDMESGVTFEGTSKQTYSTAYIRNAPMRSLWELGAIHRGAINQTINLKKYYYGDGVAADATYGLGDAAILDQVKIGPLLFVKGKINSNQRNPKLWNAIMEGIDVRWYDGTATFPAHVPASALATGITIVPATFPAQYSASKSRVEIPVAMLQQAIPATVNNDRDYEAYIGRTAQLLTSRADAYSMLIVAESLQEYDGLTGTAFNAIRQTLLNPVVVKVKRQRTDTTHADAYCSVTGRQKVLVHVVRDAWKNTFKIVGKRYLEDW